MMDLVLFQWLIYSFSEYAEGSSNNKYFEIYNPTANTVDLSHYAYPNVSNAPTTPGVHEYWNSFAAGAQILPNDVYVVAHPSADASILAEADETFSYLSNGDDGFALVYGIETSYTIMDWLGNWDGDPGAGWDVAGVTEATKDHTLVRKCDVTSGNTDWTVSAGTDSLNSEWTVYPQNTWTYVGSHVTPCPGPTSLISDCDEFTAGPTAWPYVLEAVNISAGAISQGAQTFTMNVTSLPAGGATFRVAKTTANGNWFFGPAQTMVVGSNGITVSAVTFNRTVKFQFSTGDVEFDALTVNGVSTNCLTPPPPPTTSLISDCDEFTAGPTAWPYVLTATTPDSGAASQGAQTFTMNVTNLPTGGADFRVAKTTANGSWFFGPAQTMTLGTNGITVSAVTFNRTVKFQFSSGDVEFDALSLNGVASGCVAVLGCTDPLASNYDASATVDDGSCTYCVYGCTDPLASNYDALATCDDGSCTYPLSQIDLPISWDDATVDYTVSDFGGNASSVVADPAGLVNNVLQSEKTLGAQTWGGTTLGTASGFATAIPFASGATTMTAHVYSPSAGVTIKLKAEDSNDPTKSVETDVVTTTSGAWESLIFDFANQSAGTAQIDFTYTYDKLSIFYDFGNAGAGDIYYLDSVMFGGTITGTPGCTDPLASNYDALATVDDGSCLYSVTFNVDMNCEPAGSFTTPNLESPYFGWCGGCIALTDADGDGVWSVTLDLPAGNFEYKYAVDSWAGQEDLVDDMVAGGTCAPVTDYVNYANRLITVAAGVTTSDTYGSCDPCVLGCTDPLANNYDPLATGDDGSCSYCSTYTLTMNDSYGDGWNGNTFDVYDASGALVSSSTLSSGSSGTDVLCLDDACYDFSCGGGSWGSEVSWTLTDDATGTVILSGGAPFGPVNMCVPPVFGCTDPSYDNYDATATIDDGSCANTYTLNMFDSWGDGWNGNTWTATSTSTGTVFGPYTIASGSSGTETFTSSDLCFTVVCDGGSYQSEVSWDLLDGSGTIILSGGAPYTGYFGTCVLGCTDPNATNYDPTADIDDGSCTFNNCSNYTLTMIDSWGDGWNGNTFDVYDASGALVSSSTLSSGSSGTDVLCLPDACYDITCGGGSYMSEVSWTLTDDATGTVILSGGAPYGPTTLCVPPVFGCTDPSYDNYDATATVDDGSCANTYTLNMFDSWGDGWNGNTWTATSTSTGTVFGPYTIASGSSGTETFTSSDLCFTVVCDGGSYQSEVSWDLLDGSGTIILSGGAPYTGYFGTCVLGCTDPNAPNYDPTADVDDGSCIYGPCFATAPTHEDFSAGTLPSGYCTPTQWATYATTGGPWVFAGTPGYQAASNGRAFGTYTWVDFSGTDVGVSLEVEDIDVSGLTTGAVFFDYYQDWGTNGPASSPNILNVEVYDSSATSWTIIGTIQAESAGWETHAFALPSYTGTIAEIRFTAESGGLS